MPRRRDVTREGTKIAAWEWPGGEPAALLLHGVGNYARYWDAFASEIGGRLRLVAADARGHGDTDAPAGGYATEDFVRDAVAVQDAFAIDRALVVGHSMGGHHAIALAAAHPRRVSRLVVVDSAAEPLAEGAERARRLSLGRPASFADRAEAEAYLRRTSPGYADAVYAERLRWLFRPGTDGLVWRSSAHALASIFAAGREPADVWDRLRAVACPALLVRGTRSNVLSADVARRMVSAMRDARLVELDAGHNVALERPRELAEAVLGFAV